jgi:cell division septation protein DedD
MAKPASRGPGKKPFMILSFRAVVGSVAAVFLISAWMFGMGVMVGRGTAPVEFDLDLLKKKIASLSQGKEAQTPGAAPQKPPQMKEKTTLDFYEVLPKKSEEPDRLDIPKAPSEQAGPGPAARKAAEPAQPAKPEPQAPAAPAPAKPAPAPAAEAPGKPLTVQVSAVKSEEEARKLLEKLRQRGYAAYVEPIATPDKGTLYRVRMGEFPSRDFARSTVERLQKDGFAPMVVPK